MMLQRVAVGERLYALVIRASFKSTEKYNFLTPNETNLQTGINYYRRGDLIPAHAHIPCPRHISQTEEVVILRRGRMLATIYDDDRKALETIELGAGDVICLFGGGHGFELLEDAEILEVKQGPYVSRTADKVPL